jgi:hypothetical protein
MQGDGMDKNECSCIHFISHMVTQALAWATVHLGPRVWDKDWDGGGRSSPVGGPRPRGPEGVADPAGEPSPEAPVIKGSSATDLDDVDFVYNHTHFHKYKAYCLFKDDYKGHRVAVERGLMVTNFDECAPRI